MSFFSGSPFLGRRFALRDITRNKILVALVAAGSIYALPLAVQAVEGGESSPSAHSDTSTVTTNLSTQSSGQSAGQTTDDTQASDPATSDPQPPAAIISESSTTLSVNNESVTVPANGTVSKTIITDDGTATINLKITNQSSNTSGRNTVKLRSSSRTSQTVTNHSTQQVTNQGELQP